MKKKESIDISIIVVNFNSYFFLNDLLLSIRESKLGNFNVEKIIVDNGSTDNSESLISTAHPDVTLIANKRNLGFAKANNQAMKKSAGRFILFLNPDTLVDKKAIFLLASYLDKHKDVAVVSPKLVLESGKIDDACHRGFPTPWNAFCHFAGLSSLFPQSQFLNGYHLGYKNLDKIHEIDACAGACMMVRKKVGDKIGWFDQDYFWYGEDLDFCFRVKKAAGKIIFYPEVEVVHYKGVSSGIKKHSQHLSYAGRGTKLKAQKARFAVMRLFYEKHYQDKYPKWVTGLVMLGIKVKELFTLLRSY